MSATDRLTHVVLSKPVADCALMRLPAAGNPHKLYEQIVDAGVRLRRGDTVHRELYLDASELEALRDLLPEQYRREVPAPPARRAPEPLTNLERDSVATLVAAVANAGLDTYGLTPKQQAAVHRALGKLVRT